MSIQNQFTPQEIEQLVAGEPVSKSTKAGSPPATNKTSKETPVVDSQQPKVFKPTTSVPISDRVPVTRPMIRDKSGNRISPDEVVGVSEGVFDRIDEDQRAAKKAFEAEVKASQEIKKVASPENLLNRLNAQHRQLEKLKKEVADLKKGTKG